MMAKRSWYQIETTNQNACLVSIDGLPLDSRGLTYGDGFFTTMLVQRGDIAWIDEHIKRITTHANALQLTITKTELVALTQLMQKKAKYMGQGTLKLMVMRAPQAMAGYGFSVNTNGTDWQGWLGVSKHSPASGATGSIKLPSNRTVSVAAPIDAICLSACLSYLPPTLAGLKTLNRLDNVLAAGELQQINHVQHQQAANLYGEGLVKNVLGQWVEGTMSNVCYRLMSAGQNNAIWYTPPLTHSGVAGVMCSVLLAELNTQAQTRLIERPLTDGDLPKLTGLFFCNAVRGIMPVKRLNINDNTSIEFKAMDALAFFDD